MQAIARSTLWYIFALYLACCVSKKINLMIIK
ncbi:hypothetical protein Pvag_0002 [Pantoea vagans C9-1]|nr:hypothetical protein Pvag_0002 [Pantoea vagans C9-1]